MFHTVCSHYFIFYFLASDVSFYSLIVVFVIYGFLKTVKSLFVWSDKVMIFYKTGNWITVKVMICDMHYWDGLFIFNVKTLQFTLYRILTATRDTSRTAKIMRGDIAYVAPSQTVYSNCIFLSRIMEKNLSVGFFTLFCVISPCFSLLVINLHFDLQVQLRLHWYSYFTSW